MKSEYGICSNCGHDLKHEGICINCGLVMIGEYRICDVCDKVMTEGFCIDAGSHYYCDTPCRDTEMTEADFLEMYEEGGETYWTDWEGYDISLNNLENMKDGVFFIVRYDSQFIVNIVSYSNGVFTPVIEDKDYCVNRQVKWMTDVIAIVESGKISKVIEIDEPSEFGFSSFDFEREEGLAKYFTALMEHVPN